MTPFEARLREALEHGPLRADRLCRKLWPPAEHPRAWRSANHGGPPGCYRTLAAAIARHNLPYWWERGVKIVGKFPAAPRGDNPEDAT